MKGVRALPLVFTLFACPPVRPSATQPPRLRDNGLGAVAVGMSLHALNAALHESFTLPTDEDGKDCTYVHSDRYLGAEFMILHGRVGRVDIESPTIFSDRGVHIGDSEARVKAAYRGHVRVTPDHYDPDDGQYLTVLSEGKNTGIRFETFHGRVTGFYAGTREAIVLVEGCQ